MLQDPFGRKFYYLRLSITDVCNFSCDYCLPDGYKGKQSGNSFITLNEVSAIARAFSNLGTEKIRITGGEPSLRKDLPDVIATCRQTSGIKTVGLTTNGYKLPHFIHRWIDAGLNRLNISIDSLDPKIFHSITGHDRLQEILKGIELAQAYGLESIKINTVLMRDYNQKEINKFIDWVKDKPVTLRFIELMQTGDNISFFDKNHVSGNSVKQHLLKAGWKPVLRGISAGPAQEFSHPDSLGKIGLIMPYDKTFCDTCNRLRVSSKGNLHLCLFGEQGLPLRQWCCDDTTAELEQAIADYVKLKKASHFLHDGNTGATEHLAMIGG